MKAFIYLVNNTSTQPNDEENNSQVTQPIISAQDDTNPDRPRPRPTFK